MTTAPATLAPEAFLQLAGHPLRWRLLGDLARSDRTVRELTALAGEPQNLVSYHLAKLRDADLVSSRRSSADRRDAYYTVDLARLGGALSATGAALHPGLRLVPDRGPAPPGRRRSKPVRVLFLCTGNSARSQVAEALLRHRAGGQVDASSAGSHPKPLHPNAERVLRADFGIDLAGHRPKHVDELGRRRFDRVITLCDKVREVCPELPGGPEHAHWSIADPALGHGDDHRASYPAFERVAADLDVRIGFLLAALDIRPAPQEEP